MSGYSRCRYESQETNEQCTNWFETEENNFKWCHLHKDIISSSVAGEVVKTEQEEKNNNKPEYIQIRDNVYKICASMSLDELDEHIAGIEKEIEKKKTELASVRAVKGTKFDALSDEERKERQKIKLIRPDKMINPDRKSPAKKLTEEEKAIGKMMKSLNITEDKAKEMLGLV